MKTIKINTLLLFFFLIGSGIQTTQAQFWKKLEKRVTDGVEEAILRKTEEKSIEKTENAIDSVFEAPKKVRKRKKEKGKNKSDEIATETSNEEVYDTNESDDSNEYNLPQEREEVDLPSSYNFEWKYVLKMESEEMKKKAKGNDFKITYFLSQNSTAFGSKFEMGGKGASPMGNMLMIMDMDNGANLILMEMNGQKIMQKMPSFSNEDIDEVAQKQNAKDYTIEKIGTKTILGYQCQGFKITSEDGIITTYIAKNAPVSFNQALSGNSKFKPKGFKTEWIKEIGNGLMLEMQFISNKKKKHNMKMTCVKLVEETFSINLSEYKSFMNMGNK